MSRRRSQHSPLAAVELELLRRATARGAALTGAALALMTGLDLELLAHQVREVRPDQVPESLGGPEAAVVGVHLKISGDTHGEFLLALDTGSAVRLLRSVLPEETPRLEALSEMQESALLELGNVLAGTYLNALGRAAGARLLASVPAIAVDMAGAVVDNILVEATAGQEAALVIETALASRGARGGAVTGHILLLPDPAMLPGMLRAIKAGAGLEGA